MYSVDVFLKQDLGIRGRLVVQLLDDQDDTVDQEVILKHPFLLRIRMALAVSRMKRRQRKIAKFLARHS